MQTSDHTAARLLDDVLAGRAIPDLALAAGGRLRGVTDGVFDLLPAQAGASDTDVLLTVGIHGNETAPVEVVMGIVDDLLHGRLTLARLVDLMASGPQRLFGLTAKGRIAVGVGAQGGQGALSIGYGKRIGDRASFSLGASFASGESSAGAGFGFDL